MSYDNDTDEHVSSSSSQYFESPAAAKREALKQQLQREGVGDVSEASSANDLQALKRKVLRTHVAKEKKQDRTENKANDNDETSIGTKTREQELKAAVLDAGTKQSAESTAKQGVSDTHAKEELQKSDVQGEGG